ncbi:hypothetical protein CCACVL1_03363, partial [Corchorus capsularis]
KEDHPVERSKHSSWSPKRISAFTELRIYNFKQDEVRVDSLETCL